MAVPTHAQSRGEEVLTNGLGYIFGSIDNLLEWRRIQKLQLGNSEVCGPLANSSPLETATSNGLGPITLNIQFF